MRRLFFSSRILYLVSALLILPILLTIYLLHVIKASEASLLENQKAKLSQAAYILDQKLSVGLDNYLVSQGLSNRPPEEQIKALSTFVNEKINEVKSEHPEVHLGFYYAPLHVFFDGTDRYDVNFSLRRKKAFDDAISQRTNLVQTMGPEEGGVVEIYRPVIRNDKVEGVIRSAEYLSEIGFYGQRRHIELIVYSAIFLVVLMGLGGTFYIFRDFVTQVQFIKRGLRELEEDLSRVMPKTGGELGEIIESINRFAHRIAELNLYTETMLAVIDEAIVVVNAIGQVVLANKQARELFALPANVTNHDNHLSMSEFFTSATPLITYLERTLQEGKEFRDLLLTTANGQKTSRHLLVSVLPLKKSDGQLLGAVVNCRDLTERVQLEEKVRRQERLAALGKLVTGVAHEIRTPLTSISCYIQHWLQDNKPSVQALTTIQREIYRLDHLVEQLLYFAKPAEARFTQRDLNAFVQELVNFFCEIHQTKYHFLLDLATNLPPVWLDAEQMERAVMNIIFNAMQAMPEGGVITISTSYHPERQMVALAISDTGCGIPKENLVHLFEPFYTTKPKGTGLGLAIAYEIIRAHGGQIEVESEVGMGSKFIIYLPGTVGVK